MSKLAERIEIDRAGGKGTVYIDGEEFPWHIVEDGVEWQAGGVPMVTLTLFADHVEVRDSIGPRVLDGEEAA